MGEADDMVERLYDALIWCGGSADFAQGGKARRGWVEVVVPLLREVERKRGWHSVALEDDAEATAEKS